MISILKLFFLGSCSSIQMHASTNHVKLVTEQPKALSPIHRANSSSPVTFLNSFVQLDIAQRLPVVQKVALGTTIGQLGNGIAAI
jgi:hypothetical protein